ncbi:MAG: sugar ABC transporter permease [Treponema sp.]|nr:MAG: sugar ABC transporter permease [Treponema sp.]
MSDSNKTPWLLVIVAVWQGCGYYMIVYLAGLQNIPTEVIEAAKIDGASGWQRFRYITLPLMIPSLTISFFLTIANALKSFDLIYAMIGPTGYATGTVPFVLDIYFDAFSLKQAGLATAKAMVLFVVIVIVTGIQLYVMKRKEVEA